MPPCAANVQQSNLPSLAVNASYISLGMKHAAHAQRLTPFPIARNARRITIYLLMTPARALDATNLSHPTSVLSAQDLPSSIIAVFIAQTPPI